MIHGGNVWQGEKPSEWLDFSANLRPEGMPGWVRAALLEAMENVRYYPDPDMQGAKAALADFLGVPADCILPTAGGISAIQLANKLPGSETVIFTPSFCEYRQFAMSPVRKIPVLKKDKSLALPEKLDLKKNSLVWLCNPMNPVGYAFSRAEVMKLLKQVEAAKGWLVVDEAFIEYCSEFSVLDFICEHEHLLVTGSMTKILGIPGVRLGYLCAQPRVLNELKKHQCTWELSCFADSVARALPGHRADIQADSLQNAKRREELVKQLLGLGVYVYPSMAAFVLADFGRPAAPIAEKLKEEKILVRSCMNFDEIDDGCHLRLAVKDEESNRRLIHALQEAMKCAENH